MTSKPKSDELGEARGALADAEAHLARLKFEANAIALEQGVLRNKVHPEARERKAVLYRRADELKGTRSDRGELESASHAVNEARRRIAEVLDPLLPLQVAERALTGAEAALAKLRQENDGIWDRVRSAALANDVEEQIRLEQRADELPRLVAASERACQSARLGVARAQVVATQPAPGDLPSEEHRQWREREHDLRRAVSDRAMAAAAEAMAARAPVVRSVRHSRSVVGR